MLLKYLCAEQKYKEIKNQSIKQKYCNNQNHPRNPFKSARTVNAADFYVLPLDLATLGMTFK